MNRILIIEDEDLIRKQLTKLLTRNSFDVCCAATIDEALQLEPDSFDLLLADIKLPGAPGTDILAHVEHAPVIVMTSHASVRSAVESMKLGAIDYVSKPFDHDELLLVIERSLRENRLSAQNAAMRQDLQRIFPCASFTSVNEPLRKTVKELKALKDEQRFVFLHGERGSGKELIARMVHESGERARGPLLFADLPSYSSTELGPLLFGESASSSTVQQDLPPAHKPGLLRAAHAGTLILRNVVELPIPVQKQLVSAVHNPQRSPVADTRTVSRPLDVRIIALNMESIDSALEHGLLDDELASCFENGCYSVPALRDRREDLQDLAEQYLGEYLRRYRKRKISISKAAMHALLSYHWPGNVNELKSVMERAALMVDAEEINPAHLGIGLVDNEVANIPVDLSLDGYFRYFVQHYQDQLSETELASKLGISRKALWERRQKMNLPKKS